MKRVYIYIYVYQSADVDANETNIMLKYVQIHIYTVIYFTVGGIRPSMTDQLSGLIYKILRSFFVACEPYESYKFDRFNNRIAKRSTIQMENESLASGG